MTNKIRKYFEDKYFNKCLHLTVKEMETRVNNFRNPKIVEIKILKKLFVDVLLQYMDYYILKSISEIHSKNNFPCLENAIENLKSLNETPLWIKTEIMENYFCEYQQFIEKVVICKSEDVLSVSYKKDDKFLSLHTFILEENYVLYN